MPPTFVPPGAEVKDLFFPTSYVRWNDSEWVRSPLYGWGWTDPFTLGMFLTLEVRGKKVGLPFKFATPGAAWSEQVLAILRG